MTFDIFKTSFSGQMQDAWQLQQNWIIETDIETMEDALILAEVAASEHADRIDVKYKESGDGFGQTGFTFTTNNGTQVWYTAKPTPNERCPKRHGPGHWFGHGTKCTFCGKAK